MNGKDLMDRKLRMGDVVIRGKATPFVFDFDPKKRLVVLRSYSQVGKHGGKPTEWRVPFGAFFDKWTVLKANPLGREIPLGREALDGDRSHGGKDVDRTKGA